MTTTDRIDGIQSGLAFKAPVRVATTANITLSGLQTIDGVTVVANDRVLVKDQTTTTENGIYDASSSGWTRSKDFDGNRDATDGTLVGVRAGSTNADKVFRLVATNPVVFGTSALTWTAILTFESLPLAPGSGGTGVESLAALKTALGLGAAAYLATGTDDGQVPVMDATGYPAADGSQITNLSGANITGGVGWPPNFLSGLILSNAADADHDITVAAGYCRNAANTANVTLASAITKRADATWAEGTGNGGAFPTTSLPTSGTYHMFLIVADDDGAVDAGFDTSVSGANVPTGWSVGRRVGSVVTDGSANIRAFTQKADYFRLSAAVLDVNVSDLGTTPTNYALTVPAGIEVEAEVNVVAHGAEQLYYLYPKFASDQAASESAAPLATTRRSAGTTDRNGLPGPVRIWTDTSREIRAVSSDASGEIAIATLGWTDTRGRLG